MLPFVLTACVVGLGALALYLMGRDPICPCGTVRLWNGEVPSPESSQHLTDWWSFSHVIHGFAFYAALRYAAPRLDLSWRFLAATAVEVFWELVENSDWVIDRYRAATIAVDYNGDSIVNSLADVVAMWLGFLLARRLPVWLSLVVVILFETIPMLVIRDGLLLNILMLVWPVDAIRDWQAAG